MKQLKYLNGILTVIAICLVVIVLAVTGLIPKANAEGTDKKFVSVPLNSDGSINVKFVGDDINVNIKSFPFGGSNNLQMDMKSFPYGSPLQVEIKK